MLVTVNTTAAVTIQYANLTMNADSSVAIYCNPGSNVTIEHCEFNCTAGTPSTCKAVQTWEAGSLYVGNCDFSRGEGVIMQGDGTGTTAFMQVVANSFNDCYCAAQFAGLRNDPKLYCYYNQITSDGVVPQTDQVSVYNSSGTAQQGIFICWNFIEFDPDAANQVTSCGGIVAGDGPAGSQSDYQEVSENTILNGAEAPIGCANPNDDNTSTFTSNTALGIGYPNGESMGVNAVGGVWSGNLSAFWDKWYERLEDIADGDTYPGIQESSQVLQKHKDYITLAHEQAAYQAWSDVVGTVGGAHPVAPTFPPASDFNF